MVYIKTIYCGFWKEQFTNSGFTRSFTYIILIFIETISMLLGTQYSMFLELFSFIFFQDLTLRPGLSESLIKNLQFKKVFLEFEIPRNVFIVK